MIFRFKKFAVSHGASSMRVGTDAVTLGAWADVPQGPSTILDVGCGCGIIALMMAQRAARARVMAIDTDAASFAEAGANFAASQWGERLRALHGDFLAFAPPKGGVDLVICNPPFFAETLLPPDGRRCRARHDDGSLPLPSLIRHAASILSDSGSLALILPINRREEMLAEAAKAGLGPLRLALLRANCGKPPKRVLAQLSFHPGAPTEEENLVIDSPRYRQLVSPFYL